MSARNRISGAATRRPLTARQRRFAEAYAACSNGTQAAIQAGYAPRSARVTSSRMLTKANVAAEVLAHRQRREAVTEAEVLRIVKMYVTIAFSRVSPMDYLVFPPGQNSTLRPVEEWTQEMRIMCGSVRVTTTRVRITMRRRDPAMRALTRFTGGF